MAITTRAPARSRRAISVAAAMNGASTASPTRRLIVPYLEAIAEAPYLFDGALVKKLNQLYPDSLDHAQWRRGLADPGSFSVLGDADGGMARMRQNAAMQVDGWLKDQKEAINCSRTTSRRSSYSITGISECSYQRLPTGGWVDSVRITR